MGVRPSELYEIAEYPGDPVAFWFDSAVVRFGKMVESDVERACRNSKDEHQAEQAAHSRLMKWLDHDGTMQKQRFRGAPAITKVKKKPAPTQD